MVSSYCPAQVEGRWGYILPLKLPNSTEIITKYFCSSTSKRISEIYLSLYLLPLIIVFPFPLETSTVLPLDHQKCKSSRKTSLSALLSTQKILTMWITTDCVKFLKRWEYQTTLPASWEICMKVKKLQLEPDMEQQIGSKLGKEYVKAIYCHPAYLTYIQSTSCKMLG